MAAPSRRRRRTRGRSDLRNARIQGERAILTNNRQSALLIPHGGGGDAGLGSRLREAAEVIADQARHNASEWSVQVPPSIEVTGGGNGISILSGAPPSYPNEVDGVRHPVFGGRGTRRPEAPWVRNQYRPFLAPAADQKGDEALQKFAKIIDDWAHEAGFR